MPSHERHIEQIQYSLKTEINELYWSIAIRNFSIALTIIFGPIYIYQLLGNSVPRAMFFYLAIFAGQALLVPLGAKLMGRIGLKKLMALSSPFLSLYFVFLVLAERGGVVYLALAAVSAIIVLITYWPARHVDFAKFATGRKRGRQIGVANILVAMGKMIAPLLGGIIIVNFGFSTVFIVAAILTLFSSIPLFFSREVYETYTLSWTQSFAKIFEKQNRRTSAAFFFEGIEYFVGIFLFPIFVFTIFNNIETIGWVTSLSLLAALIFTYVIGWLSDKRGDRKVIVFASVVHGFAWVINSFIRTPLQFVIYSSFFRLAETANHLPMISIFYERAKKKGHGIDEYIVFHEIAHNAGRVVMAIIVIVGFSLGFESWLFYFTLAGVGALFFRLMK